jgi:prevent-host-death family protein
MPKPTTTLTSREFHQNSAKVKRAVQKGPVIITDRGKPALVLLTYEAYESIREPILAQPFISLADALYDPDSAHIEFDIPISHEHPKDMNIF